MPDGTQYTAEIGPITGAHSALDPIERSSEIMFGLIMALTFTCTISVTSSTRADVMTMLAGALGCNVAWGLVDSAMYLLSQIVSREQRRSLALELAAASPADARRMLIDNLPEAAGKVFSSSDLDRLANGIGTMPRAPRRAVPTPDDFRGAVHIFLLVFLSTLPVALPFLFMKDVGTALRTSNAIAVALLFIVGTGLGKHMKWTPYWVTGLCVSLFGALLVAITIALGG
ncbi:MAG: hypothetical protein B7Y80_11685 [Hyphomicrobium sp. 32-62-53]|nr:MAG: hypothetical protein B7Z29_01230 [Hyphomicrobium sp. 12-62-95]OYX99172.1 MAG: hypothetical protein B7Y80_11685 [Hyphomicrobium sp. 32-62-53]